MQKQRNEKEQDDNNLAQEVVEYPNGLLNIVVPRWSLLESVPF